MAGRQESPSIVVPVTVAVTTGVTSLLLLAFARQYVPDDNLIGLAIVVYAYVSVPLCAYGLVGILMAKPKFISVFANYLFLDAAVWATCRFLIAQFFLVSVFDEEICGSYDPRWSPENFHHDIVTSVQSFREDRIGHSRHSRRCQVRVGAFQVAVIFLLLAFTAAHGSVAMGMRRHAQEVEKQQSLAAVHAESEKATLVVVMPDEKAEAQLLSDVV